MVHGAGRTNLISQAHCLIYLIIAAGNTKEWDRSSVHAETKKLPECMVSTDLKDRKEHGKKSNKHKHVKTLLMIHLLALSGSSVAINFPTRYLLVANLKQQIYIEILMRGH